MRIKFKKQNFQIDAVNSIVDVFRGQPFSQKNQYTTVFKKDNNLFSDIDNIGFSNPLIVLDDKELLNNIKTIQNENGIKESVSLSKNLGRISLDIEMETGTGKTYVYIKSIFELNKKYGMSKFIVVVPSIAIREGVKKTFELTTDHFLEQYGKKARFFIYNSKKLNEIESFSSSDSIQVMIINIQAFNARGADARKIYEELDLFQSRKPIDVIAKNNPILILDEPQKMGGEATQASLKNFNPLFSINFSATHRQRNNLIYVLDPVDAYNMKIVKKIEVKGFTVKNLRGLNSYMYLEDIIISSDQPPRVKLEFEINFKTKSINRETRILTIGDNLYEKSNKMEQYKNGYIINDINPYENYITFINGTSISIGEANGDLSENDIRRIQIRETIKSHLEKEAILYDMGIKVLSLFFIDEVAKYRQYDSNNNETNGLYGNIFEEEYHHLIKDYLNENSSYSKYLSNINSSETHNGYFSIDKKNRAIDSKTIYGKDISDDVDAYDLILKDKEKLLSFDEPTRFIFSHSALREGWDNPNVFQICTLRYTKSGIQKHQEVGRGLRLCVNQDGDRIDSDMDDLLVHEINKLTVIANDSYEDFVKGLQEEISENLYNRDLFLTPEYFIYKRIYDYDGKDARISQKDSNEIYRYLIKNNYIDESDILTENYLNDSENKTLVEISGDLSKYSKSIHDLIIKTKDELNISEMYGNANRSKLIENKLTDNFYKKEFQNLWNLINRKYVYKVEFDSDELISKSVISINQNLNVTRLLYTISTSQQKSVLDRVDIETKSAFDSKRTRTEVLKTEHYDSIKYDLLGKVSFLTDLKRETIFKIISTISKEKYEMFSENPEEFITKVSYLINNEKAALTIEHIQYDEIEGTYDSNIFFESKKQIDFRNAFKTKKHIKDYVFTDGASSKSIERVFAEELDNSDDVCVYAKLPRAFHIPTPVGNYSPDWAITFYDNGIKHIYFIAETKGSMDSMQLRRIEEYKIECAKKLFSKLSNERLKYAKVDSYMELISILK
ncbi:MAG: type III restriction-modification system endonuclease [Acholeplasmataceae bacterium]